MKRLLRSPILFVAEFFRLESAGLLLMAAAVLALVLANSPLSSLYRAVLAFNLGFSTAKLSVLLWINDGLMAVFFLYVGLEIKYELVEGKLASVKSAVLPAIAALGGMVVPAVIYTVLNYNDPVALRGWAISAATDIAFALGILAILGSRVPTSLKVFLTALAILDDLGAMIIIALFYTTHISLVAMGLAVVGLAALFLFNRVGICHLAPYVIVGVFVWIAVLASGIHSTLAGVAVALMIPLHGTGALTENRPFQRLQHILHPWVSFGILPIFGLANAGLSFLNLSMESFLAPVSLGIASGLFVGKPIGVIAAAKLAVKCGWAHWPDGSTPAQVYGAAILCGIGFTMSLFIGGLAFSSDEIKNQVKIGVFGGSAIAAAAGFLVLRFAKGQHS